MKENNQLNIEEWLKLRSSQLSEMLTKEAIAKGYAQENVQKITCQSRIEFCRPIDTKVIYESVYLANLNSSDIDRIFGLRWGPKTQKNLKKFIENNPTEASAGFRKAWPPEEQQAKINAAFRSSGLPWRVFMIRKEVAGSVYGNRIFYFCSTTKQMQDQEPLGEVKFIPK